MAKNPANHPTIRSWLPFLAAAPALCALLFSVGLLLIVAMGDRYRWLENDFTMAEAALIGDVGRVFRLLEAGQSPDAVYSIRVDPLFETSAATLTPVRAAVTGDRVAVLMLLFERGAAHDPAALSTIYCLARNENSQDVEEWLAEQYDLSPDAVSCQ